MEKLFGNLELHKIKKEWCKTYTYRDGTQGKSVPISITKRQNPDKFGNTHSISYYNKEKNETIYLGSMKLYDFDNLPPATPEEASVPRAEVSYNKNNQGYTPGEEENDDLPF